MKISRNTLLQICDLGAKVLVTMAVLAWAQSASASVCWKDSYGRGVGTIPKNCDQGTSPTLVGTCLTNCPPGYRDDGLFCRKAEYGRGAGYAIWDEGKCKNENKQGCETWGAMYYPRCAEGYEPFGCCICRPTKTCPPGWAGSEVLGSCSKVSSVATCGPGMINNAGLCYKACEKNYNGIGPVCWGQCPPGMTDCGAMCGGSLMECGSSIGEMVIAGATAIGKIGAMVASLGASVGVTGVAGVINAVKEGVTDKAKELSAVVQDAGSAVKDIGGGFIKVLAEKGLSPADLMNQGQAAAKLGTENFNNIKAALGGDKGIQTFVQAAQAGSNIDSWLKLAASIDPTGLANLAMSFKKPICGK